jgi:dipeptidyl-peptidase-4
MNKLFTSLALTSFVTAVSFGQPKKFTIDEATLGLRSTLAPQNLKQLAWLPQSDIFTQVIDNKYLIAGNVVNDRLDTLLQVADINKALFKFDSLKTLPVISWLDNNNFYFCLGQDYYLGSKFSDTWQLKKWLSIPQAAEHISVHNLSRQMAFTKENNLMMIDAYGKLHEITQDAHPDIVNGQSVHRNEFGIDGGIFFSPKGNYLAFYRMDQSMVSDYPIVNWNTVPATNQNIKYPMAGDSSHHVSLGIYHPITKKTVFVATGAPKDQYLTCVTWSPDEKYIFIALLNREQNHLKLNQYDISTGQLVKTLFEESDEKYVEPQHALAFLPDNSKEFLWWSQRNGFMHLYRYNTEGKLLNQVTDGNWLVNDIVGFNKERQEVIITASKETPLERHIYAVNWRNGNMRRIDNAAGVHAAEASSNGKYIIDRYQSSQVPRKIELFTTAGKYIKNLLTAANPLTEYQTATVKQVTLAANDGTPLYGKLILPADFDASKKYPVIVYLYNGPHVQLITNSFPESGNLWYDYMTQKGFIVFTMDGRGSSNRGLAFEQATFRQLGTVEMEDQLQGVAYLKSLPYIDASRMGVHGWSFGGFMTTSLMLRHPGVFKVGVAGGPVIDWRLYEIMYTERYMDAPQQNAEGYELANLLNKAKNLSGKLLLIHGTNDDVVVWQHSINFLKAAVDNKVQPDYFVYPGHLHNVQGKDRIHLMQKITEYFEQNL